MLQLDGLFSKCLLGQIIRLNHDCRYIGFRILFSRAKMATAPQKMKVKTLEGEMLAVEVAPTNTVKELRKMLLESKR